MFPKKRGAPSEVHLCIIPACVLVQKVIGISDLNPALLLQHILCYNKVFFFLNVKV